MHLHKLPGHFNVISKMTCYDLHSLCAVTLMITTAYPRPWQETAAMLPVTRGDERGLPRKLGNGSLLPGMRPTAMLSSRSRDGDHICPGRPSTAWMMSSWSQAPEKLPLCFLQRSYPFTILEAFWSLHEWRPAYRPMSSHPLDSGPRFCRGGITLLLSQRQGSHTSWS